MNAHNKIYYQSKGHGEPLVLISGLNADRLFWAATLPYLVKKYRVITIDNRGVGSSQIFSPTCTTELMAQDVVSILDELNIETANIVGHSLGGCVAQQLAILYPDRVNYLVLCSTQAKSNAITKIVTENTMLALQTNVSRELIIKYTLTRLYSDRYLSDEKQFQSLVSLLLAKSAEESKRGYLYQANALLTHDTTHQLNKISAKTLIISGDADVTIPITHSHYLAKHIPNATMITVPNMAHMLPVEDPDYFSNCIMNFC